VPPSMRVGYKTPEYTGRGIAGDAKDIASDVGGYFKKNYNPNDPIFKKDTDNGRNINNLYSGYKLGGKGNLLVGGSLLGGGTVIASNPKHLQNHYNVGGSVQAESQELDVESIQSTRGDGVGYQASIGAAAVQNLQTSGDLVFAMHKTRHSGQF
jgi:hypothetical protein